MTPALPPIIVTFNLKGGVGKTTLAANVASEAAHTHRVLGVDLDPQASLLAWHSAAAARGEIPIPVVGLDGPSLRTALPQVAKGFDLVVIDTPPQLGPACRAALMLCSVALVPVTPGPTDLWALEPTLDLLREVHAMRAFRALAVLNRSDRRTLTLTCQEAIRAAGLDLADTKVRDYAAYSAAMLEGRGVTDHEPKSNAALDIRHLTREALREGGGSN